MTFDFAGEAACLGAAASWACAVVWFRGSIHALGARMVNLVKCALASLMLAATALAFGSISTIADLAGRDLGLIALSGIVGMAVGDTALFAAVRRLGAHRTLLLQTLGPVFAAAAAFAFLGERLTLGQALGGAGVLVAVGVVVANQPNDNQPNDEESDQPTSWGAGLALASLAALGQALGIVIAKPALVGVPTLEATLVRLVAATLGMAIILLAQGEGARILRVLSSAGEILRIGRPTLLGTYVGVLLMMAGIARSPASVAAILLATSPIFSLFVEAWVDGRRIRSAGLIGTLVAVAGVALLSVG